MKFENTYHDLPDRFYARVAPAAVPQPMLLAWNTELADTLGLGGLGGNERLAQLFSGNEIPSGADPIALAYAGHQFGNFVPQLGDGRALLLGEVLDNGAGRRWDIQLKGSGQTPFSRRGDGKAAIGPVIREYLVSEAMHQLGVPTTRSLAAVATGERVLREGRLPGAVLTRVASSHIRVGTFEFFAARRDHEALQTLIDYAIRRHYPDVAEAAVPALALFGCVVEAQAELVAHWMSVGFIHGVMNTDNTAISGETIDYGPCAHIRRINALSPRSVEYLPVVRQLSTCLRTDIGRNPSLPSREMVRRRRRFGTDSDGQAERCRGAPIQVAAARRSEG